jgi:hypothetical protein
LREELALKIRKREISIEALAKTEALQDSVASYLKKITASSRNRSAAFELAIKSGRNYQAGDQITYYVTGANKKVVAYENARFVSEWTPEARDENIDYYVAKLDDLAKKFQPHTTKERSTGLSPPENAVRFTAWREVETPFYCDRLFSVYNATRAAPIACESSPRLAGTILID